MYDPATGRSGWHAAAAHLQPAFDAAAQAAARQRAADAAVAEQTRIFAAQQAPIVAGMRGLLADFSRAVTPYWPAVINVYGPHGSRCGATLATGVTVSASEHRKSRLVPNAHEYLQLKFFLGNVGWKDPSHLTLCTLGSWMFASEVEDGERTTWEHYFSCTDLPKLETVRGVGGTRYVSMTEYCLASFFMDSGIPLPT